LECSRDTKGFGRAILTQEAHAKQPRHGSTIADLAKTAVQALLLFVILSALIGRFEIHQISMEPNFHEGQRVLVSKLDSIWSSLFVRTAHAADSRRNSPFALKRGQVVVFFKTPARDEDALIKRAIGLPGDTIELRDGAVWINGQLLAEPYVNDAPTLCGNYCRAFTLGPDEYFLMGDNRANSLDSRNFGPIPASQLVGRVVLRYWPLDQVEVYP
ncbi:MAG TPA: signal peptidase I, partial [Roseiflexaceae bacterium]|nr:signal peptidase I [Roseiflexaceae bacterium]